MCLPSILILGLSEDQKTVLANKADGVYFGTGSARPALINSLVSLNFATRAGYHPNYGSPRWELTYCGRQAGNLLNNLELHPLFAEMVRKEYDAACKECNRRHNPLLTKTRKKSFLGGIPLLDPEEDDLSENIVIMGPMGPTGEFFGYHRETRLLYFLIDSKDKQFFHDVILGTHPDSKLGPPVFALRRAIGGPGTIEMFWKNKAYKPLTKKLAGAIQYIADPDEDEVILTHMVVKRGWRRRKVNSAMIGYLENRYPDKKFLYHELTPQGRKFMESYGGEEWKPE